MASCGWLVVEFAGGAIALPYRCSSQARKVPEKQGSIKYLAKSLCASQTRHSYYFEFFPPRDGWFGELRGEEEYLEFA